MKKPGLLSHKTVPKKQKGLSVDEAQIETLERFPERCPLIPENEILGTRYRHLLYGNPAVCFEAREEQFTYCA